MILVYHLNNSSPVGLGQAAMELFFVLSGYLISKSLLESVERSGGRGVRGFAYRRFRRLMPAMAVFLVAAYFLNLGLPNVGGREVGLACMASVLGYYNFYQAYCVPIVIGFGGIWSLSLEEQFYVICLASILIFRLRRFRGTRWVLVLAVSLLGVGFFARLGAVTGFYIAQSGTHLSYLPPLRLWGFGVGVMVLYFERTIQLNELLTERVAVLLALGCVVISALAIGSVAAYDKKAFMYQWCLVPILGGIIVLIARKIDSFLYRIRDLVETGPAPYFVCVKFGSRMIRSIGLASYSIYLWQAIVIMLFVRYGLTGRWYQWVSMLALSLLFGLLSWRYVERKFYVFD